MNNVIHVEPFALPTLLATARERARTRAAFLEREAAPRPLPVAYEAPARVEVQFFARLLLTFLVTVVGGLAFLGPDLF